MSDFASLGLNENILSALEKMGFEKPMPIQQKFIPAALTNNRDIIALAQTGTGKTAAFGLPLVEQIKEGTDQIKAVVLCPTRELCLQISKDIEAFSARSKHVRVLAVYGGSPIDAQLRGLKKNPQIIVATPGRMVDVMKRKKAGLESVETVVLDEADEMLNVGFKEELDFILAETPADKRTFLFSATFSKEIARIASAYMRDPLEITSGKKNEGSANIRYIYYTVTAKNRYLALKRIADFNPDIYGIIFCRTRNETKEIAEKLIKDNYNADALHGDLSQAQREHVMKRFRSKSLQMLVATDVAARGLDVDNVSHVINYNLPDEAEVYTHRSGRTGRAGKTGTCIALVGGREERRLPSIQKAIGRKFEELPIPGGVEICEKQLFSFIDRMQKVTINEDQIAGFLPRVNKQLAWLDREALIKHFVSLEFNRFLEYYKDAPDLNQAPKDRPSKKRDRADRHSLKYTGLNMNAGSYHKITPASLMSMVNRSCPDSDITFGKIDISKKSAYFEVEQGYAEEVINAVTGKRSGGVQIFVSKASPADTKVIKKTAPSAGVKKKPKNKGAKQASKAAKTTASTKPAKEKKKKTGGKSKKPKKPASK